jgi:hypothetical protein
MNSERGQFGRDRDFLIARLGMFLDFADDLGCQLVSHRVPFLFVWRVATDFPSRRHNRVFGRPLSLMP